MKRGDIVTVALSGDYGKPRPALVVQSDHLAGESVIVVLLTSTLRDAPLYRLPLPPDEATGLREPSQVMIDKLATVRRDRIGSVIGRADDTTMLALSRMLAFVIGLSD